MRIINKFILVYYMINVDIQYNMYNFITLASVSLRLRQVQYYINIILS